MRAPRAHARGAASRWKRSALEERDVDGLRALVARLGVIRDLRALGEGAEAVRVDAGVVNEEVLAPLVGRDEAEALVVVEPLNDAGGHDVLKPSTGLAVLHAEGCLSTTTAGAGTAFAERRSALQHERHHLGRDRHAVLDV